MNPEETPTSELVEIIRRQADESWQKPNNDDPIWKELLKRSGWAGCPPEDFALIGSLDSVLRPLNGGRTMLPPRIRYDPNAGIPSPPPFYQKKVSLSQALNKLSAKTATTSPKSAEVIPLKQKEENTLPSRGPWHGLFYLVVFVVVLACLAALAWMLGLRSGWFWPPIIIGSLLATTLIGALQLKNDGKIEEKNFLTLMKMVFKKMTFLEKIH